MCIPLRHKSSIFDSWRKRPSHLHFTFSPPNTQGPSARENQDLNWCHYEITCITSNPVFLQCMFSPSHKHRLLMKTLQRCGGELQMWTERPLKEQSRGRLGSTAFFPRPKLPPHKSASRKPAVGQGRREEVKFYIRAVNHSSMLCIFPMVVWLPG